MKQFIRTYLREGLIRLTESKASEQQTLGVLKADENREEILNQLKSIDKSKNQKNLPFMAVFYVGGEKNINNLSGVFNEYEELIKKQRIKPLIYSRKGGMRLGDEPIADFIKFSEVVHGKVGTYGNDENKKKSSVAADFETVEKPIWSGNNIDIYEGGDVGKCIKYSQGHLTGRSYKFCIGQPGNTMYQSYRDTKTSSFYFIIDRNRFKKDETNNVDLSDPLHIVVFDSTKHGIELTDATNNTGSIAEFGVNVDGYVNYLKSMGVPTDKMVNKPKTSQEGEEDALLGNRNDSLDWFIKLPYEYKSKYIGRGHRLTNEQFDYLINA